MNFEDCLKKRLIKKDLSVVERMEKSLEIAERFLKSAKKNFEIEDYKMVEIAAYNSALLLHKSSALRKGGIRREALLPGCWSQKAL